MSDPIRLQLRPTGPGPTFRERLAEGIAAVRGDAELRIVAVVVEAVPTPDDRPDATKLRLMLKRLGRQCGLRADWTAPPARPKPNAKRVRRRARKPPQTPVATPVAAAA